MDATNGWDLTETGGGCTALRHDMGEGWEALVTQVVDPSAPESEDEPCRLGVYDPDGGLAYDTKFCNFATCRRAVAILEQDDDEPEQWTRPTGFAGPCPSCGSTTCAGYDKPDCNHLLAF
jgi:hypothetical protein